MLEDQRPGAGAVADPAVAVDGGARSAFRDRVTWAIAGAMFGAYLTISLFRLFTLSPMSWDLGIYTEYVKQYADLRAPIVDVRGAGFNLLGDHFQPIVALIAPFFRVFPSPATLLVAQALLTAVSVFPVVQAGFTVLGRSDGAGREVGRGRPGGRSGPVGRGNRAGEARSGKYCGTLLIVWGLAWSVLAITVIIPHFNPQHHYYYWKDGGAAGPGGPFSPASLLAQPFHGWAQKLQTSVLLLLPTAFIALGSPLALVTLPSIALRFFSVNTSYWGTLWHYNATVMPILFLAAIEVIGRWQRASPRESAGELRQHVRTAAVRHGPAMMVAAACVFAFQFPLGNLWDGSTYQISLHVSAAKAAMARVPDGATVQTTLNLLAPLAARTDTFWIGNPGNPATQYVVFDGLNSGYSPAPSDVPAFIRRLFPRDGYRQVFSAGDVYVFKRG